MEFRANAVYIGENSQIPETKRKEYKQAYKYRNLNSKIVSRHKDKSLSEFVRM